MTWLESLQISRVPRVCEAMTDNKWEMNDRGFLLGAETIVVSPSSSRPMRIR